MSEENLALIEPQVQWIQILRDIKYYVYMKERKLKALDFWWSMNDISNVNLHCFNCIGKSM